MPELPDVESFRRHLDATSLNQEIRAVEIRDARMLQGVSPQGLRRNLEGGEFLSTSRHGKFLFVQITAGRWLLLHFGMTGQVQYLKEVAQVPAHTRLLVHFVNGHRLAGIWQRRLGRIGLVDHPMSFVRDQGLGPDAYEPGVDLADFKEMFSEKRGSVKSALMDQRLLAGIGNIYSDEILFQVGLHPRCECRHLDSRRIKALHRAIRRVLSTAVERQADPERLPPSWLLRNRGKGGHCPRCSVALAHIAISGRTAYYCRDCQRDDQ